MGYRPSSRSLLLISGAALVAALLLLTAVPSSAGRPEQVITPPATSTPAPTATVTPVPSDTPAATASPTPIRPTLTPTSPVSPAASTGQNPSLAGYVWDNGDPFKPSAGVPIRFAGDGFDLVTLTDANGYFQFDQLGQDIGWLNVSGDGSPWKASVKDVAISPRPGETLIVNFSASQKTPARGPVSINVSVKPGLIGAGQTVTLTVKATNTTDQKLSGVWLTQLLPDGLTISGMLTDRGDALSHGQLAMARVGDMAPGDKVTFTIVAAAPSDGAPHGTLPVVASLFSREGISVQASTNLSANGGPAMLPVTGAGQWLIGIGLVLGVVLLAAHFVRRRQARAAV